MAFGRSPKESSPAPPTGAGQRPAPARSGGRGAPPVAPVAPVATPVVHDGPPAGAPKLGELLLQKELVSPTQLTEVLGQQTASGKRLGTLLVDLGILDERSLAEALSVQYRVPLADLSHESPEPDILKRVPEAVARELKALPVKMTGSALEVVVADPGPRVKRALEQAIGGQVTLRVAPASDVQRSIENFYRALASIDTEVQAFTATAVARQVDTPLQTAAAGDAPVVRVVNLIITQGLRDRASDIHIEPQDDRLRIRYRIDGALHDATSLPSTMGPAVVSRLKIMAEMNIVERQRSQDGQISMTIDGRQVDIRVATTATIWGEKAVLRLLDKSKQLYRMEGLGMAPDVHQAYSKLIRMPFGMVVCTGPTGSGKTTTLYATLNEVNDSERNVMTIEDPVEYVFPSINQIQIREQAGITFAGGLKAILRQDPDVILVGEIRDAETARIAVQSALTGHFVMSSLHATDAAAALHRFLDMGIEPFLIASSVVGVVGQRLLRRVCRACRAPYKPSPDEMAFYRDAGGVPKELFYRGEGCNLCSQTGYQERIGAYELLLVSDEIKNLLVKDGTHEELRAMAISQGMRPLRAQAVGLVFQDVTTIAEVMRSIYTL